jgi:hypothetical protein
MGEVAAETTVDWRAAAEALTDEVARVTGLLRSVQNPAAPGGGNWSLAEVAMHLSQVWILVPGLAAGDLTDLYHLLPHLDAAKGGSPINDIWEHSGLTTAGVVADTERDPRVVADRIEERARNFLAGLDAQSTTGARPWLVEGVTAPLSMLLCHLLNETIVHGYDIARADGRRWPIPPRHAAMVFDGFLVPVIAGLTARTMVDQSAAAGLRATYEVHVRGGGRHLFVFDDGSLRIERPGSRRIDCHISADPATFLLVAWDRRSQWPAIARGQLVAWGRKPWLGPRFRKLIRTL